MAKQRDGFRLGIAVIVIFVLFFSVVLYIGSGWDTQRKVTFVVRFPHTLNLPLMEVGAEVIGFGQVIGRVVDLRHVEALPQGRDSGDEILYLQVKAEVNESVRLRQDCRLVAEGPVLGGKGHLRVTDRGASADLVDASQPVYGGAAGFAAAVEALSAEIDETNPQSLMAAIKRQLDPEDASSMMSKLHASMDDLNTLTKSISVQMNANDKAAIVTKIGAILDNLNELTGQLRDQVTPGNSGTVLAKVQQALDSVNSGLGEAVAMLKENRPRVTNALTSIEHVAATVDTDIAGPVARELDATNPQALLARVHESFEKIDRSLADLNVVTEKGRTIVVLNEARINRLFADAREASAHLKTVSKDIRNNPWRLLYRPDRKEMKESYILDTARAFSVAAGRLDAAAAHLEALASSREGGVPADDPELAALRAQLLETFDQFRQAEQSLWEQLGSP